MRYQSLKQLNVIHSSIYELCNITCNMTENIFCNRVVNSISQLFGPLGTGQLLGHPKTFLHGLELLLLNSRVLSHTDKDHF